MTAPRLTAGKCQQCGGKCQPQNVTCAKCGGITRAQARANRAATEPPQAMPVYVGGHVCRPHHRQTNWRGKGCPPCAVELIPKRKRPRPVSTNSGTSATPEPGSPSLIPREGQ